MYSHVYQSTHIRVYLCMYVYVLYLILDEFGFIYFFFFWFRITHPNSILPVLALGIKGILSSKLR